MFDVTIELVRRYQKYVNNCQQAFVFLAPFSTTGSTPLIASNGNKCCFSNIKTMAVEISKYRLYYRLFKRLRSLDGNELEKAVLKIYSSFQEDGLAASGSLSTIYDKVCAIKNVLDTEVLFDAWKSKNWHFVDIQTVLAASIQGFGAGIKVGINMQLNLLTKFPLTILALCAWSLCRLL